MALIDKPAVDVNAPISPEAAKQVMAGGQWPEDEALKLVLQDAARAENYENQKQWVLMWPVATTLYQSPYSPRYWEGTQVERANIPFYTVATAVNSLVPQIINGLFYENPPFLIQERPGTRAQAARAMAAILSYQLDEINFREELRLGVFNAVLFGTSIWKWGWETFERKRKIYVRKNAPVVLKNPLGGPDAQDIRILDTDDDFEEEEQTEYVDRPSFEHIVNLRHVLVDPGLNVPDCRKAKYVVHRMYMTWNDLEKLRERPGYNLPSKETVLSWFQTPKEPVEAATGETAMRNPLWDARSEPRYEESTADPFNEPLEVLERWDKDRVIVVLQKKLVIANDENVYGEIPFLSVNWWDVPEAFWGMGLSKTIGAEQRLQQGITNAWLDDTALNLQGVYTRVVGKNIPTQSIRISPGKIINVEKPDDFQPMKRTQAVPEAGQHLAMSDARAEKVSGSNEITGQGMAGAAGHSNLARSSAGAQLLGQGAGNRPGDFVEKLANQVLIPFVYSAHEMNRALLPVSTMHYILSQELEHEFMQDKESSMVELLNARVKVSILAAAKMQARRNMAQGLPIMIQFLTNEQTINQLALQGLKVDVAEIMRMLFEVSDWKNLHDVILQMSPEDQQRWQAMQPAMLQQQKLAAQKAMADDAFNKKTQIVDQENMARAGREVLRHGLEAAETPMAINGLPGGTGFGSNV